MKKFIESLFVSIVAVFSMANAFAANVAKIGDVEYATINAAFNAVKVGETIELLADVECSASIVQARNFTLEGHNHTLKCSASSDNYDYFVNVNGGSTQTFKNLTIDANGKEPYAVQCIGSASKLVLDNVTIKNAKSTLLTMGYGIHVNGGKVVANNLKVSDCSTASVFLTGNSSNGTTPSFEITGDNCDLDVVGVEDGIMPALSVTAKGFSVYDVSAKYSYSTIIFGTREGTKNLSNVISALSWNQAISEIQSKISGLSVKVKSATVTLKGDVKFKEDFTSNESRLTVDGAGKTVTGKFIFNSSTPTTINNIVLGNGSVLDCTASTKTGFSGVSVAANTTIDILLPASTDMNSYALPVALATDAIANIFVGDKKYIAKNGEISPAEKLAQIGDKQYATLQEAIDAANGATVQVLKDVALTSSLNVPAGKTLTLNLAGRKVTVSGADYALVNNGNLTIVDMGLVTVVAAEATIGDETAAPILIMAPSANDGVAVIDDATGGSIAGVQNNGTFALESGAVVAASASVPAIDNTANAVVTITGGTVEGKLQSTDKTALTITGGSFTGESNVSDFVGGDYGVDENGAIVKNVAKIGEVGYLTLYDAVSAAQAGDTIVLAEDVAISKPIILTKNVTIDGGNKTITPAADFVADGNGAVIVFANGATAYSADRNYTVKNLTIEGFSGLTRVLRANFCDSLVENCSFVNNSVSEGVVTSSYGKTNVKDCTFDGNTSAFSIVNIGFDVSSGTELAVTVDGSEFVGNKAAIALIYAASSVAVTDNYFNGNVHSGNNANAAAVLAGPYTGTVSYMVDIKENAFVNAFGQEGGNALPDVFAEDWSETWNATTSFDLSSNYWNGGEPNYAVSGKPSIDLTDYYTIYADGVKGGLTEVKVAVAKIGDTPYATLADALAAAQAGDTVVLFAEATGDVTVAEGCEVIIDLNGNDIVGTLNAIVNNGTLTINDTVGTGNVYTTDVSAQGRAAIVNRGTIVINGGWFGDANNDTSDRNAINRGNALKNYGTAIVNGGYFTNISNQYIGSDAYAYAINTLAGGTTVINEATVYGDINGLIYSDGKTTVNGGSFTLGRPGEENNLWYLAYGDVVIKGGTWDRAFKVPSWNTSDPKFNGNVVVSGGDFNIEIPETYRAEGYQSVKQPGKDLWQVGKLPNAEVINVGPYTVDVGAESYYIYNITNKTFTSGHKDEFDLQVTLGFIANDTVEEAAANAYGQYLTDFRIKIDGIENGSFVADEDCYLAGYYPFFGGWVKVNLDGMTIENNVGYPVITGVTEMPFTYETICDIVQSFICGIHLSDEVLEANPNLKVSLELGLAETQEKMLDGTGFITVGDTYDYTKDELQGAVALTGSDYYTTVDAAVAAALESGDFVKLVNDATLQDNLELAGALDINLCGNTLYANAKTLMITDSVVTITNGTLSAFTKDNVTLSGNAVLTVTDKNVADSFRQSDTHYVSQNMDGTYSIMLKSAFRVFITMVDGEPRIGFFQDFAQGAAACTLLGATSLENAEWTNVAYTQADDASGASALPLYWVKLNQDAEDTKVYRFFKIGMMQDMTE